MKYHPSFPGRFGSIEHATAFCRSLFGWYNTEHRHAGIAMLTPQDVHYGRADEVLAARVAILFSRVRAPPGALRPPGASASPAARASLDQPPAANVHPKRAASTLNPHRRCLKLVDRFRPATRSERKIYEEG